MELKVDLKETLNNVSAVEQASDLDLSRSFFNSGLGDKLADREERDRLANTVNAPIPLVNNSLPMNQALTERVASLTDAKLEIDLKLELVAIDPKSVAEQLTTIQQRVLYGELCNALENRIRDVHEAGSGLSIETTRRLHELSKIVEMINPERIAA